ncbi:hypothetical protein TWF718_009367 [Orbilia javanica]|uniref:Uncharacterized protein n=1 Tax=Orbilia javanica TaxID=47235 RepID=A0AAN8RGM0_9PEZI
MPSTIPYDPSLVLAQVVDPKGLALVKQIADYQAPVDAAEATLNSAMAARRSLDMLKVELANMHIDASNLNKSTDKLNADIIGYAKDYVSKKIDAEAKIIPLRAQISGVNSSVETPVDYIKTEIKKLPLAADSISMDVQYFSVDAMKQKGSNFADAVSGYVSSAVDFLGDKISTQATAAARNQVSKQLQNHEIIGTLVLSVSCTHKNASVLAPLVLNVDKGVRAWNRLFPHDLLVPTDKAAMATLAKKTETAQDPKFSIISGMTFGSSFVGMVHIVNNSQTRSSQSLSSIASSLQEQLQFSGWIEDASGGFGINSTFSDQLQNLLSSQNVSSHVTLICMGVIPSIVSSEVQIGVQKFADFDPKSTMEALAVLQNSTTAEQGSVSQGAEAARTGGQMVSMKAGDIKAVVSALADVQDAANKILDINSMMTALDDYLKKAADGDSGVPINFYLKDITKIQLAEMWVNKYFPTSNMIQSDDSAEVNGGNGSNTGNGGNANGGNGGDNGNGGNANSDSGNGGNGGNGGNVNGNGGDNGDGGSGGN